MKKQILSCLLAAILLCGSCASGNNETTSGTGANSGNTGGNNSSTSVSGGNGSAGVSEADGTPVVYMTTSITPESLIEIYEALDWTPGDHVAVKLSTGEPDGGSRSNTAMHYQVAADHGYTAIANMDIMDEDGSMSLPCRCYNDE